MMKFSFLFVILFCAVAAQAKDIKYPVSAIPAELKQGMNAVVRVDEMIFKINSKNSSSLHTHMVVTIFNANAKHYAEMSIGYDKMSKIRELRAAVYDASGETIKKLKTSEIYDGASFDGASLFNDDRYKAFDLKQAQYPYTVDIEYDMEYDFLSFISGSTLAGEKSVSVQSFKYQLVYPLNLKPRFRVMNIDEKPVVASAGPNLESTTWTLQNVMPRGGEPMSPAASYVRRIDAAPNNFEMGGYAGDMSNWENIGMWLNKLNSGRDALPEATKRKVHELTDGLKTKEEKAKVLYEYMQSKTRYVGIQLGIGGWQPFDAKTVDETGYGDCKALSNYMVAMLKEVGVQSYYAIITAGAGAQSFDPEFPTIKANHAVVAVPAERDTLWLECTSQTSPFAYTGDFTDNRYALLATENGGKLVKTPYYSADKNVLLTVADVTLDASGNAKAKVTRNFSGLQYGSNSLDYILNQPADEQKKWLQQTTEIPSFDVGQFSLTNKKGKIPTAVVKVDLSLNKYASVSNKRVFLTPNLMNRWNSIPEKVDNRKNKFIIRMGFTDIDTIKYHIPENIYPEFLPADSKFTSRFGTYESGFKLEQGSLIYFRRMTRKDGEYPAEAYQELIDFYKNINKADNAKLVFLSKT